MQRIVAVVVALTACSKGLPPVDCPEGEICETEPACGDGVLASTETCDGANLDEQSCVSRGFDGGELVCSADCGSFDESACYRCGDGTCAPGEDAASCAEDCFVPSLAFTADEIGGDVGLELFVVDAAGLRVVNLSAPMPSSTSVFGFEWSPDRRWIAYVLEHADGGFYDLYTVPAAGGTPTKIAGEGFAASFAWAPDSSRIAYRASSQLYTVAPTGGTAASITGPLIPGDSVGSFAWAPDSSRIAYTVGGTLGSGLAVDLPAGGDRKSIHGGVFPRVLRQWAWAPDASRIAFIADRDTEGVFELFTSLPDGTGIVRASGALVETADVRSFSWALDSSRIAYLADQRTTTIALYTSRPDGTANVRVSGAATEDVYGPVWAPDGSRLAYGIEAELFTGLADGSGAVSIGTDTEGGEWAPDSSRVAYLGFGGGGSELFTVLPTGGDSVSLASTNGFRWAPDGSRIAIVRGQDLVTLLPAGGGDIAISDVGDDASVRTFAWSPDGAHLALVVADGGVHALHVSPSAGGGTVKVSGTTTLDVLLASYAWAPE